MSDLRTIYELVYAIYSRQGEDENGFSISKSITVVEELPTENIDSSKIYLIQNADSTDEENGYDEYIYKDNKWEKFGSFKTDVDLTNYYTKTEIDSKGYVDGSGVEVFLRDYYYKSEIDAKLGDVESLLSNI